MLPLFLVTRMGLNQKRMIEWNCVLFFQAKAIEIFVIAISFRIAVMKFQLIDKFSNINIDSIEQRL